MLRMFPLLRISHHHVPRIAINRYFTKYTICGNTASRATKSIIGDHERRDVSSSSIIENENDTPQPDQRKPQKKMKLCYLDLRGLGISILERLVIEECILKHDLERRHWIICGTHTATPHKYLQIPPSSDYSTSRFLPTFISSDNDFHIQESTPTRNDAVSIVMGIGGKPKIGRAHV